MYSHFDFKNLIRRAVKVVVPRDFLYLLIGLVFIILLILVASNMYLQEMLLFEGVEKSTPLFTEEEMREYGEIYKELEIEFQNEIGLLTQGFSRKEEGSSVIYYVNRADEKIYYGVYNEEHHTINSSKIYPHSNGQNINAADYNHISDIDDSYNDFPDLTYEEVTFIESEEFKNGVKINYIKTSGRGEGESNFKDILTVISMMLDQKQTRDGTYEDNKDLKSKVPELIRKLYKMSHTYTGAVSELYNCNLGCRVLFYFCNEEDSGFKGTGIDLVPFDINPHDNFDDYSEEDFEIVSPYDECVICEHNGKGCIVDSERCYHGSGSDEDSCKHAMGSECENSHAHHICSYDGDGDHDCSDSDTGCGGHYDCDGHEHYNCPGHFYVCCMGHRDIQITVKIAYIDEIVNMLKNS